MDEICVVSLSGLSFSSPLYKHALLNENSPILRVEHGWLSPFWVGHILYLPVRFVLLNQKLNFRYQIVKTISVYCSASWYLICGIRRNLMGLEWQISLTKFLGDIWFAEWTWWNSLKSTVYGRNWIPTNQTHGQIPFQFLQSQIPSMDSNSIKFQSTNQTPPKYILTEILGCALLWIQSWSTHFYVTNV